MLNRSCTLSCFRFFRQHCRHGLGILILTGVLSVLLPYPVLAQDQINPAAAPPGGIALAPAPPETWTPSWLLGPNAIAVDPYQNRIFVTSNGNNFLLAVNGATGQTLAAMPSGHRPWGVTINFATSQLFSGDFFWGKVYIYDAITFVPKAEINLDKEITFLASLGTNVFAVSQGADRFYVIDAITNTLFRAIQLPAGAGPWGLTVNPALNRVYVGLRKGGTILTLDGNNGWQSIDNQTIRPCGNEPTQTPYSLAFDEPRNRLWVACVQVGAVSSAMSYSATTNGLTLRGGAPIGDGGAEGGGGLVVNPVTGNVFATNSLANTVTVINDLSPRTITLPTGVNPFGAAVDPFLGRVYVANRQGRSITIIDDQYTAGLNVPNAIAVNANNGRLYVTNRLSNNVSMYDGRSAPTRWLGVAPAGSLPWGMAVDATNNLLYVAAFGSDSVYVYDATTLSQRTIIPVGSQPTLVVVNPLTGAAFVVAHGTNQLQIIDPLTLRVVQSVATGGAGAWGVTVDPKHNVVFVTHREGGRLAAFDGNNHWAALTNVPTLPCSGEKPQLYGAEFNPVNDKLYLACAVSKSVDNLVVLQRQMDGAWSKIAQLPVGVGGADGGGGLVANPTTGRLFFTNSAAGTVTVFDANEQVIRTVNVGKDPFGAALDPVRHRIYVGLQGEHYLALLEDLGAKSGPAISLTRTSGCTGLQVTVNGSGFPVFDDGIMGKRVRIRLNGQDLADLYHSPAVDANGRFAFTFPLPATTGGQQTVSANLASLPLLGDGSVIRTPATDLPIVFIHGAGGGEIVTTQAFDYLAPADTAQRKNAPRLFSYAQNEAIWLGAKGIWTAVTEDKDSRYYDVLALAANGRAPLVPSLRVAGTVRSILYPIPILSDQVHIYDTLFAWLADHSYRENERLFLFNYDWRCDLDETAVPLQEAIIRVLHRTGKQKVNLLVHSTGGLVARNYLIRNGTQQVDQFISIATPYLGTIYAAQGMTVGYNGGIPGIHEKEFQRLVQNWPAIYQLLPSPLWFAPGTNEVKLDPRYLELYQIEERPGSWSSMRWTVSGAETSVYLAGRTNAPLLAAAQTFQNRGIGDMSYLTDQYFGQRIAGTGIGTLRTLRIGTRQVCVNECKFLFTDCKLKCYPPTEVFELKKTNKGDDTALVRSAIGGNLPATDDRYYCVAGIKHGELPIKPAVHTLLEGMLSGNLCSNTQVEAPCPPPDKRIGASASTGATATAAEATEIMLLGPAQLHLYDSQGRHAGPHPLAEQLLTNEIPGVIVERAGESYQARIETPDAYTVVIQGTEHGGAYLRIDDVADDGIIGSAVAPGIPVTPGTMASLVLSMPGLPTDVALTFKQESTSPPITVGLDRLQGATAADTIPPAVRVTHNDQTGQVTITAHDDEGGSGVAHIYYSASAPPAPYTEYSGAFAWPAGASCIYAVAVDGAGNTGPSGQNCLYWLPLVAK